MDRKTITRLLMGVFLLCPAVSSAWRIGAGRTGFMTGVTALSENREMYSSICESDQKALRDFEARRYPAVHVGTYYEHINFLVPFACTGKQGWPSLLDGKQALVSGVPQFFFGKIENGIIYGADGTVVLDQSNPGIVYVRLCNILVKNKAVYEWQFHCNGVDIEGEKNKVIYQLRYLRQLSDSSKGARHNGKYVARSQNDFFYTCEFDNEHEKWNWKEEDWGPWGKVDMVIYRSGAVGSDLYFFPAPALLQNGLLKEATSGYFKGVRYRLKVGLLTNEESINWQRPNANIVETSRSPGMKIFAGSNAFKLIHSEFYGDNDGFSRKALSLNGNGWKDSNDWLMGGDPSVSATPAQYWKYWNFGPDESYGLYGIHVSEPGVFVTKMEVKGRTYITYHVFLDNDDAEALQRKLFAHDEDFLRAQHECPIMALSSALVGTELSAPTPARAAMLDCVRSLLSTLH